MSSTSASSQSRRAPLHEKSNSENNKLQIRLVPYSPPRPATGESGSPGAETELSYDDAHHGTDEPTGATWTRTRTPLVEDDRAIDAEYEFSSPPSSPAPTTRSSRARVSGSKQAIELCGPELTTPSTPVSHVKRTSVVGRSRGLSAPVRPFRNENATSPTRQRPRSRRRVIKVHSDGTFSLDSKPSQELDRTASNLTYASTVTSREPASFSAASADPPSSPPSSVPERSVSPSVASSSGFTVIPEETPAASSPWNYRMVGGLRKVPGASNIRAQKGKEKDTGKETGSSASVILLPDSILPRPEASSLVGRSSEESESTDSTNSTTEGTANYKVIGRSSPARPDSGDLETASFQSNEPNYRLIGESSPAQPLASSPAPEIFDTPGSRNFIVHGGSPSSLAALARRPRPQYSNDSLSDKVRAKYSQESLVIPPLNPQRRSSQERSGYYRRLSRESLRGRSNSFSTISSIISQDTASLLVASTPNLVRIPRTASAVPFKPSTWTGQPGALSQQTRMEPQPNQWSSHLSTVISEYEGSDPGSRGGSAASWSERGSSVPGSRQSRPLLGIPSTLALATQEEVSEPSQSPADPIDRPSPAYMRGALPGPAPPTVRDVDEHGDGLADLNRHQLQHKPSWRSYLSRRGSDRDMHSAASSRAGSLTIASIPTWAWVYYGSGERRWLATVPSLQSLSSLSEAARSRPASSFASGSPAEEQPTPTIWNPRRRPRELPAQEEQRVSIDVTPPVDVTLPVGVITPIEEKGKGVDQMRLVPKKKTSSIWSPHLRFDRRAIRYSAWEPPSIAWATEGGILGLRNVQILLFAVGFGIPFAWMVGSLLPLPTRPVIGMFEEDDIATGLGISKQQAGTSRGRVASIEETRFQNARWWRNLNRVMSIVGLLILGAIVALVVVGIHQGWGQS